MNDHNNLNAKQAKRGKAFLAIVNPGIGNTEGGTGENQMRISEIKTVLLITPAIKYIKQ